MIEQILLSQREPPVISELVRVECASALAWWVHMDELDETQANRIESTFHDDVREGRFRLVAPNSGVFERAMRWLLTRPTT